MDHADRINNRRDEQHNLKNQRDHEANISKKDSNGRAEKRDTQR